MKSPREQPRCEVLLHPRLHAIGGVVLHEVPGVVDDLEPPLLAEIDRRARLQGMDRSLEEAAMILGADEITTFWRVTVPQLWPGIVSGAMLAFTMSFDDYVITSFLTGPGSSTLPIVVYTMVRKNI